MIDAVIIAVIVAPAIFIIALRSNAALTFLSLCLGSVLAQVAATDTSQVVGSLSAHSAVVAHTSTGTISLILLLLPPALTAVFMMRTLRTNHLVLQVLPAIALGAAVLLLSQPYLPPSLAAKLNHSALWLKIDNLEVIIIGLSALVCLLTVWVQRPKHSSKHDDHK